MSAHQATLFYNGWRRFGSRPNGSINPRWRQSEETISCFQWTGKNDKKKSQVGIQRFLLCQPRVKKELFKTFKNGMCLSFFCFVLVFARASSSVVYSARAEVQNLLIRTIVFLNYIYSSISFDPLNTRKLMLQRLTRLSPWKAYFQWFRKWLVTGDSWR